MAGGEPNADLAGYWSDMVFIHVRHKQVYAGINNSYALALANDLLTIAV
jgi:hypothetical protein